MDKTTGMSLVGSMMSAAPLGAVGSSDDPTPPSKYAADGSLDVEALEVCRLWGLLRREYALMGTPFRVPPVLAATLTATFIAESLQRITEELEAMRSFSDDGRERLRVSAMTLLEFLLNSDVNGVRGGCAGQRARAIGLSTMTSRLVQRMHMRDTRHLKGDVLMSRNDDYVITPAQQGMVARTLAIARLPAVTEAQVRHPNCAIHTWVHSMAVCGPSPDGVRACIADIVRHVTPYVDLCGVSTTTSVPPSMEDDPYVRLSVFNTSVDITDK